MNVFEGSIVRATMADLEAVVALYGDICDHLATSGVNPCGWNREEYPTRDTALEWLARDWLYLLQEDGRIAAGIALTHKEEPGYAQGAWQVTADSEEIYALHTVVTHPDFQGRGYSRKLMTFAKEQGCRDGMKALRLDVAACNAPALALYESEGFACVGELDLFGFPHPFDRYRLYEYVL